MRFKFKRLSKAFYVVEFQNYNSFNNVVESVLEFRRKGKINVDSFYLYM